MFPRISRVRHKGKVYEYLRVVESCRDRKGKMHQRVVVNLGRLEELRDGRLDQLVEKLRKFCEKAFVLPEEIRSQECVCWGPILLARRLWEELELDNIIGGLCQGGKLGFDVGGCAFVLVANLALGGGSEHGLARWLEHNWVCDRSGVRFLPRWRPEGEVSKESRVKVAWDQLDMWYRTLDAVCGEKEQIERELYLRLRDLFSLKVDTVFYEITSLSFAWREQKGELKRHGYSREGKPTDVQVLLGLVMVGGFPIAGHVFHGSVADTTTVQRVVEDVEERFGIREIIFVADSAMMSEQDLLALTNHRYALGHRGRRDNDAKEWLARLGERWRECSGGVRVQEVESGKEGVRVLIVESDERKQYEQRLRQRSMERTERRLSKLREALERGSVKSREKIAVWAERALQKDKGYRYFSYTLSNDGRFHYFLDHKKMEAELLREGRYILTTNHPDISPEEAVAHYKELWDIEAGFREFKDVIQGRPIYHQRDDRICAHLFIAQLALLLLRQLRHHLDEQNIPLSPSEAIAAVKSIGIAQLDLNGKMQLVVSSPKRDAKTVLQALGITNIQPPKTPAEKHTRHQHKKPNLMTN